MIVNSRTHEKSRASAQSSADCRAFVTILNQPRRQPVSKPPVWLLDQSFIPQFQASTFGLSLHVPEPTEWPSVVSSPTSTGLEEIPHKARRGHSLPGRCCTKRGWEASAVRAVAAAIQLSPSSLPPLSQPSGIQALNLREGIWGPFAALSEGPQQSGFLGLSEIGSNCPRVLINCNEPLCFDIL